MTWHDHPDWLALVRGVCESPADDLPRLVLADWLEENGEPERAEFIRLDIERWRRWPDFRKTSSWERSLSPSGAELNAIEAKLLELYGTDEGPCRRCDWHYPLTHGGFTWSFERGFVESVSCDLATFMGGPCGRCMAEGQGWRGDIGVPRPDCSVCKGDRNYRTPGIAPRLFASQPVTKVTLTDREPAQTGPSRWTWFGPGDFRDTARMPECIWNRLEHCDWTTRDAALEAMHRWSHELVAYGRANAEGMTHAAVCEAVGPHHGDRCNGGRVQSPNAQFTQDCRGCHGTSIVRRPGLPPLAETTIGRTT